ncbi:uncharacterized protein BBA_02887 [Beauveria bassiana ARSEF 2860]|uniref:Uncharacterized protein n=1 Tax=Beauveria bassiana (strain ARSEF 2860) TaxID=655819 RepID=J5K190_BEAB2|nr:uncharacterized protein BBA_02887 [Beauveria bassiana ARSEF 2860]EJP67991.1 hypothetical protein BBA_02887 [Beauveria bassiana ARSEF 2860]
MDSFVVEAGISDMAMAGGPTRCSHSDVVAPPFRSTSSGAAVTNSAQTLLEALPAVEAGEALLQAILRLHPDFQNDWRIRQHSWSDETQPASAAIA